jgi:hypothetical protein
MGGKKKKFRVIKIKKNSSTQACLTDIFKVGCSILKIVSLFLVILNVNFLLNNYNIFRIADLV